MRKKINKRAKEIKTTKPLKSKNKKLVLRAQRPLQNPLHQRALVQALASTAARHVHTAPPRLHAAQRHRRRQLLLPIRPQLLLHGQGAQHGHPGRSQVRAALRGPGPGGRRGLERVQRREQDHYPPADPHRVQDRVPVPLQRPPARRARGALPPAVRSVCEAGGWRELAGVLLRSGGEPGGALPRRKGGWGEGRFKEGWY